MSTETLAMAAVSGVLMALCLYRTVDSAKTQEWGWFYWFLTMSVSGAFIIGAGI